MDRRNALGLAGAGIVTPMQDHLDFVAFDVIAAERDALGDLLQTWTAAAARMTAGIEAGPWARSAARRGHRPRTPARYSNCRPAA